MYLEHPTLDGFDRNQFAREVAIALDCMSAAPRAGRIRLRLSFTLRRFSAFATDFSCSSRVSLWSLMVFPVPTENTIAVENVVLATRGCYRHAVCVLC